MFLPSFSLQRLTKLDYESLLWERLSQPSSCFSILLFYIIQSPRVLYREHGDHRFIFIILLCSSFTAYSQLCFLPFTKEASLSQFTRQTRFYLFFYLISLSIFFRSSVFCSFLNFMPVLFRLAIDSLSKKGGIASFSTTFTEGLGFLQRLMLGLKEKSSFLNFSYSSSFLLMLSLCYFYSSQSWFLVATSRVDPEACADDFFDKTGFYFGIYKDFLSFSAFFSFKEWLILLIFEFLLSFCSFKAQLALLAGLFLISSRHSLSKVGLNVHQSESFSSSIIKQGCLASSQFLLSYSVLHIWLNRSLRVRTFQFASVLTLLDKAPPSCCLLAILMAEYGEIEIESPLRGTLGLITRLLELFFV